MENNEGPLGDMSLTSQDPLRMNSENDETALGNPENLKNGLGFGEDFEEESPLDLEGIDQKNNDSVNQGHEPNEPDGDEVKKEEGQVEYPETLNDEQKPMSLRNEEDEENAPLDSKSKPAIPNHVKESQEQEPETSSKKPTPMEPDFSETSPPKRTTTRRIAPAKANRSFFVNDDNHPKKFPINYISTTKYSLLSFFPVSIAIQFTRLANVYFLVTAILQCIPIISPLNPFSAVSPLIFVISISLIREALEDLSRFHSDKKINAFKTEIMKAKGMGALKEEEKWEVTPWRSIRVGTIIRLRQNDTIPSDIVLLSSSIDSGACFIETASLDGEKNLKPRMIDSRLKEAFDSRAILKAEITCEPPNEDIHQFQGFMTVSTKNGRFQISLSEKQLLLRGAKLVNTEWIIGTTVYTGKDTKIMQNSEKSKFKQSNVEKVLNTMVISLISFIVILCIALGIGSFIWNSLYLDDMIWAYDKIASHGVQAVYSAFSYFLLLNTMLPVSLLVNLEIIKVIQAMFIAKDSEMKNKQLDQSSRVFTPSINEELGQISYLFSDKTGTLTANKMEFRILVFGNNEMEFESSEPQEINLVELAEKSSKQNALMLGAESSGALKTFSDDSNFPFCLPEKSNPILTFQNSHDVKKEALLLLSVCHECIVTPSSQGNSVNYEGMSPDEVTLVSKARDLGYAFQGSTASSTIVKFGETKEEIPLLKLFPFDSNRKRMGVVIRHNGVYKLLVKGADSIILARCSEENQPFKEFAMEKITEFSKKGFRTLLLAIRVLSDQEYEDMDTEFQGVIQSMEKDKLISRNQPIPVYLTLKMHFGDNLVD